MNGVKRRDDTINKLEVLLKQQATDFARQLSQREQKIKNLKEQSQPTGQML